MHQCALAGVWVHVCSRFTSEHGKHIKRLRSKIRFFLPVLRRDLRFYEPIIERDAIGSHNFRSTYHVHCQPSSPHHGTSHGKDKFPRPVRRVVRHVPRSLMNILSSDGVFAVPDGKTPMGCGTVCVSKQARTMAPRKTMTPANPCSNASTRLRLSLLFPSV